MLPTPSDTKIGIYGMYPSRLVPVIDELYVITQVYSIAKKTLLHDTRNTPPIQNNSPFNSVRVFCYHATWTSLS